MIIPSVRASMAQAPLEYLEKFRAHVVQKTAFIALASLGPAAYYLAGAGVITATCLSIAGVAGLVIFREICNTSLINAIQNNNIEQVQRWVFGVNRYYVDKEKNTFLHIALQKHCHAKILEILQRHTPNLGVLNQEGQSILDCLIKEWDHFNEGKPIELVKAFLHSQTSLQIPTQLLQLALQTEDPKLFSTLIQSKNPFDSNFKDQNGNTLLHFAASRGLVDDLNKLLKKEADPSIQNNQHETPLMVAVQKRNPQAVGVLIDGSRDYLSLQNLEGKTALDYLIQIADSAADSALDWGNIKKLIDQNTVALDDSIQKLLVRSMRQHNDQIFDLLVRNYHDQIKNMDNLDAVFFHAIGNPRVNVFQFLDGSNLSSEAKNQILEGLIQINLEEKAADFIKRCGGMLTNPQSFLTMAIEKGQKNVIKALMSKCSWDNEETENLSEDLLKEVVRLFFDELEVLTGITKYFAKGIDFVGFLYSNHQNIYCLRVFEELIYARTQMSDIHLQNLLDSIMKRYDPRIFDLLVRNYHDQIKNMDNLKNVFIRAIENQMTNVFKILDGSNLSSEEKDQILERLITSNFDKEAVDFIKRYEDTLTNPRQSLGQAISQRKEGIVLSLIEMLKRHDNLDEELLREVLIQSIQGNFVRLPNELLKEPGIDFSWRLDSGKTVLMHMVSDINLFLQIYDRLSPEAIDALDDDDLTALDHILSGLGNPLNFDQDKQSLIARYLLDKNATRFQASSLRKVLSVATQNHYFRQGTAPGDFLKETIEKLINLARENRLAIDEGMERMILQLFGRAGQEKLSKSGFEQDKK